MAIQSIPNSYSVKRKQPVFTGAVDKMLQLVPETKVSKGLTKLDQAVANVYMQFKKFNLGITADEIAQVSKLDGFAFLEQSYYLIAKKLGIAEDIRPGMRALKQIEGENIMAYQPITNLIYVDMEKIKGLDKNMVFALLRHEYQHFLQNSMIMRHEVLGVKAIDEAVVKYRELEYNTCKSLIETYTPEQLQEFLVANNRTELQEYFADFRKYFLEGNTQEIEKMMDNSTAEYKTSLINWRNNIIQHMGLIKSDSSLTPKIESYLKEFSEVGYYRPDGRIDYAKYVKTGIEQDALMIQDVTACEFAQPPCFAQYYREKVLETLQKGELEAKIKASSADD